MEGASKDARAVTTSSGTDRGAPAAPNAAAFRTGTGTVTKSRYSRYPGAMAPHVRNAARATVNARPVRKALLAGEVLT
jgi:hypothetical protein